MEKQVRVCEERSEELRRRVYWISTWVANTSVRNATATSLFAVSNVMKTPSFTTRFARCRFIQIHNLIAAEKHRKTLALQNSMMLSNDLPEAPSEKERGRKEWTREMAQSIQARNEIGSEEVRVREERSEATS